METSSNRGFRKERLISSCAAHHPLTYSMRERLTAVKKPMEAKKEHSDLDIPMSPLQAMEYLSRSWSPSSSDFFQILSLNSLLPQSEDAYGMPAQREGKIEGEDTNKAMYLGNKGKRARADDVWACPANGRVPISSSHQKHKPHRTGWMNVGHMKAWFGGDILGSISRTCREKRKEELRLHMAHVHAALSVAQLAAAVAGVVADGSPHQLVVSSSNQHVPSGAPSLDGKMSAVVASAAALVATVCAEAAEMAGASRAHIASAISSGLAAQTPADVLTLTATAATCLRGAATLELRANSTGSSHVQEEGRQMLVKGAELPIRIALGKIHIRMVCVFTKHDKLTLRLGKKYLQGALTTYKEYRIIKAEEETKDGIRDEIYGFCLLVLGTTEGTIEVLFDDERQRKIWKSTISHVLCDQEMRLISP